MRWTGVARRIGLSRRRGTVAGLAVIRRHVPVDPDKVRVTTERDAKVSPLTVDIEIPMDLPTAAAA